MKDFKNIPKGFPNPEHYYSDDILNPVFYEWVYLSAVNDWFKNLPKNR